jgi:hypothetical protein
VLQRDSREVAQERWFRADEGDITVVGEDLLELEAIDAGVGSSDHFAGRGDAGDDVGTVDARIDAVDHQEASEDHQPRRAGFGRSEHSSTAAIFITRALLTMHFHPGNMRPLLLP